MTKLLCHCNRYDGRIDVVLEGGWNLDRIEQSGLDFFRRVRDCFRTEAKLNPTKVKRVNANRPVEDVWADVWAEVEDYLQGLGVLDVTPA